MECKFANEYGLDMYVCVLISTYWNVNTKISTNESGDEKVLISTYWNVNLDVTSHVSSTQWVLISTYWNVNVGDGVSVSAV